MRRLLCLLFLVAALPFAASAGSGDDFGIWSAVNLKAGITDKFKAQLFCEMRTKDHLASIDCIDVLPSISYRILPFLEFDLGAEFVDSQTFKDIGFRPSVILHLSSEHLSFSLREMFFVELFDDGTPTSYTLRSRAKMAWNIPSTRINPYVSMEVYTKSHWEKTRHYAGIDFDFGKRSNLDIFYMYYTFAHKDYQRHILGVTYNIKVF